jgi:REP element-mobilizing transposase RayT
VKRHPSHNYDSPAGYFVTFATLGRLKLLGNVVNREFVSSQCGRIVQRALLELPDRFPNVQVDVFQIMPDHVHCILVLLDPSVACIDPELCRGLGAVMKWLNGSSARKINAIRRVRGTPVWQKGYYERIIRSHGELDKFREYIYTNPIHQSL